MENKWPRGTKGAFRKITITLPPLIYGYIQRETSRRKLAQSPNSSASAIVAELLDAALIRQVVLQTQGERDNG